MSIFHKKKQIKIKTKSNLIDVVNMSANISTAINTKKINQSLNSNNYNCNYTPTPATCVSYEERKALHILEYLNIYGDSTIENICNLFNLTPMEVNKFTNILLNSGHIEKIRPENCISVKEIILRIKK